MLLILLISRVSWCCDACLIHFPTISEFPFVAHPPATPVGGNTQNDAVEGGEQGGVVDDQGDAAFGDADVGGGD